MSDEPPNSGTSSTRRAFLRASAGITATGTLADAGAATPNDAAAPVIERIGNAPDDGRFETPGRPSRSAHRALAMVERNVAQRSDSSGFDRVANAVEYLGLGSDDPIDAALERADAAGDLDGVLLDFPPGTYRVADGFSISPDGTFGIVGSRAVL